jgi:phosphoglycolate phosphatase-like HAD superfamily hydrolase
MHLIWDLDGTLIDSYHLMVSHLQILLKPYKIHSFDYIMDRVLDTSVTEFLKSQSLEFNIPFDNLKREYNELSLSVNPSDYPLIEHVQSVLKVLSQHGHQHYIYTHRGIDTLDILKAHELLDLFKEVVTSANEFSRKPSPHALEYLIRKYNMSLGETYYIGDRSLDILCGHNAGIQTIYVGLSDDDYGADFKFFNLNTLKDKLLQLK